MHDNLCVHNQDGRCVTQGPICVADYTDTVLEAAGGVGERAGSTKLAASVFRIIVGGLAANHGIRFCSERMRCRGQVQASGQLEYLNGAKTLHVADHRPRPQRVDTVSSTARTQSNPPVTARPVLDR